jgi:hypothetical protein
VSVLLFEEDIRRIIMNFKILCIDGGGIRGIYPAYILHRIEEEYDIKINKIFGSPKQIVVKYLSDFLMSYYSNV